MAKMKNYTDADATTGRAALRDTPFPTAQVMAEYLRASAKPGEFKITTGAPAIAIEATDEAYAAALDAYEKDKGLGKYAEREVNLREPAQPNPPNADAQAVNAAIANYDTLSADDVIAKAAALSPEQRATVARYETANKNRKTVLAAFGG